MFIYNALAVKKFIDIFNRPIDDVQLVSLMPHFNVYSVLNYLAHIYLSGFSLSVQTGNFIGDFVKGKQIDGLQDSLEIMARYKVSALDPHQIVQYLKANEMALGKYFDDFFPDLQKYCHQIR